MRKSILFVDDHPLFRAGVALTLKDADMTVHEVGTVVAALDVLASHAGVDLVLYDWHLPTAGGASGLLAILQASPDTPAVVISADEDSAVEIAASGLGAAGYVSKAADASVLLDELRKVLGGRDKNDVATLGVALAAAKSADLTPRQLDVLRAMGECLSNKEISDLLKIADATVRAHVSEILRVLRARNRTHAVVIATQAGLIVPKAIRRTPS